MIPLLLLLFFFLEEFGGIAINSFQYLVEFTSKPSDPGLFFVERFLIADLTSSLIIGLLRFFIFS